MSNDVLSHGYIGVLKNPVTTEQYGEITENFYECGSNLQISYDGKLVFSSEENEDNYQLNIGYSSVNPLHLVEEALRFGLVVDAEKILPYNCTWYNGADSPMSLLTLEEFLEYFTD